MGGTSKTTQTQTSQLSPYEPAAGTLNGILGNLSTIAGGAGTTPNTAQTSAINQLSANGAAGSPFTSTMTGAALGLLNGGGATKNDAAITSNLNDYKGLLTSTANGSEVGANSALKPQLDQITRDVTDQVNGAWAAAGRDGSPGNAQALGRGIAAGVAPVIAAQYNTDKTNQLNAASSLYNAGNTTYGILNGNNATANSNIASGTNVASAALNNENWGANTTLAAEAQRSGIPLDQYKTLLGMVSPVAATFGTQNGSATGTSEMSGLQQMAMLGQGLGSWSSLLFGA
ncbi:MULTISPECIES: tail fiber domain-containing protein [unclassified Bradyrhizobium]|uniref:tail fiber domain-containing protein n=1 Tax=unclassified Bradyrhizobium TaxID=2631580 RepID=UPI002916ACB0|nr:MULTISPECIES: tail fiber domain-containing protein [unclassified Bradyrhizobium]